MGKRKTRGLKKYEERNQDHQETTEEITGKRKKSEDDEGWEGSRSFRIKKKNTDNIVNGKKIDEVFEKVVESCERGNVSSNISAVIFNDTMAVSDT